MIRNIHDMNSRALLTTLLRLGGRKDEALALIAESLKINPCDYCSLYEQSLLTGEESLHLKTSLASNPNWTIETAVIYRAAGFYQDACRILSLNLERKESEDVYPMVYYYLADCCGRTGDMEMASHWLQLSERAKSDYCFPHRLEDIRVLEKVTENGKVIIYHSISEESEIKEGSKKSTYNTITITKKG